MSAVDREKEFLDCLAGVLEVDSVSPADDYRVTPLWGSLTCFALKVTLMQRYGLDIPFKELDSLPDVKSLMEKVLG